MRLFPSFLRPPITSQLSELLQIFRVLQENIVKNLISLPPFKILISLFNHYDLVMVGKGVYIISYLNIYSRFGGCIDSIQASVCSRSSAIVRIQFLLGIFGDVRDLPFNFHSCVIVHFGLPCLFSPLILYFPKVVLKQPKNQIGYKHTI